MPEQATVSLAKEEVEKKKKAKEDKPADAGELQDDHIQEILSSRLGDTFTSDDVNGLLQRKQPRRKQRSPPPSPPPAPKKPRLPRRKAKSKPQFPRSPPRHPASASASSFSAFCGQLPGSSVSQPEAKKEVTKKAFLANHPDLPDRRVDHQPRARPPREKDHKRPPVCQHCLPRIERL
jgi:hypothetical protein